MLTERTEVITSLVPRGSRVVDIGTDHGFIPVYLVEKGICPKAYATDVSAASLGKAQKLIQQRGLSGCIETRQGNGLSVIKPGEADSAIIAGMGGLLIRDILEQAPETVKTISTMILQPMVAAAKLRKWLIHHDFMIIDEELTREDRRFYEIIVVTHGRQSFENEIDYEISPKLIEKRHPLLPDYLQKKLNGFQEMMKQLQGEHTTKATRRYEELEKKKIAYEEVYHWLANAKSL